MCVCVYIYIYTYTHSAAGKFVNPLEFSIFLYKVLKVDRENPIKQMRHLFIQENDPILHICEWQKYVNLLD